MGATTVHVTGGPAALNVTGLYSNIVVTADTISTVILNAQMAFRGSLTETGGTVVVNGASHFVGSTVRLTSNLAGHGLLAVSGARDSFGTLEVDGAIGSGVMLAATGTDAAILLDQPTLDQGTITLSYARLEIKGEAEADSVSYKDSLVSLYHGDTLLSSLKVIGLPGKGYSRNSVNDGTLHFDKSTGGSVFAYNDSPSDFIPDLSRTTTLLPQHV